MRLGELARIHAAHKGDLSQVTVVARRASYFPGLSGALTVEAVRSLLEVPRGGTISRYELPVSLSFWFVLEGVFRRAPARLDAQRPHGTALSILLGNLPIDSAVAHGCRP